MATVNRDPRSGRILPTKTGRLVSNKERLEARKTAPKTSDDEVDQIIQAPSKKATSGGAKVTVACKIPAGLRMRVFRMIETTEPIQGGGRRPVMIAEPLGEAIVINGCAQSLNPGEFPKHSIVAGYGLTPGVDKDFFEKWLEQNEDAPYVKNELVFAYDTTNEAEDAAKEREEVRSGLEPFSPEGDPRRPQPRNRRNLGDITLMERE